MSQRQDRQTLTHSHAYMNKYTHMHTHREIGKQIDRWIDRQIDGSIIPELRVIGNAFKIAYKISRPNQVSVLPLFQP